MRKMTSTIAQLFLSYKDRALIFQTSQQENMFVKIILKVVLFLKTLEWLSELN